MPDYLDAELAEVLRESLVSRVSNVIAHIAEQNSFQAGLRIGAKAVWTTPKASVEQFDLEVWPAAALSESVGDGTPDMAVGVTMDPTGRSSATEAPATGQTPTGHGFYARRWWVSIFGHLEFIAVSMHPSPFTQEQQEGAEKLAGLVEEVVRTAIESRNLFINVYHEVLHQLLPLVSDVNSLRKKVPATGDRSIDALLRRLETGAQGAAFSCENIVRYLSRSTASTNQLSKPRMNPVSLTQLVSEATDQFRDLAEAKGIELRYDGTQTEEVKVKGDSFHLKRMLYNLLNNAVKYSYRSIETAARRHIDVEVVPKYSPDRREAAVVFENYGVGLVSGEEQLVIRAGYRGKLAKREGIRGCGVGLSEVADIARMHGGRVKIRAKPVSSGSADGPSLFTVHAIFPVINSGR
jgi:signal transduction histidine kinase